MFSSNVLGRRLHRWKSSPVLPILVTLFFYISPISAFVVLEYHANNIQHRDDSTMTGMRALVADEGKEKQSISIVDKNGKEISEGMIIRVAQATKAYQVPSTARGNFDENKQFVPSVDSEKFKYLVVPEGMCGIVTKVYVQVNLSANYKVQVKFAPGEDYNKCGFDPPLQFLMHFSGKEVECVT
jgi:hypothetical protein